MTALSNMMSSLVGAWEDWHRVLINPQYLRVRQSITWPYRSGAMMTNIVTVNNVMDLITSGQFSFQISQDESIIQIFYEFDDTGENLQHACLTFYSTQGWKAIVSPTEVSAIQSDDEPVSWIRLDFDPEIEKPGPLHHLAHLHLAGMPLARVPFEAVPSPRQFIDFVIASYYPETYARKRLDKNGQFRTKKSLMKWSGTHLPIDSSNIIPFCTYMGISKRQ